jgi:hypothetical protein
MLTQSHLQDLKKLIKVQIQNKKDPKHQTLKKAVN